MKKYYLFAAGAILLWSTVATVVKLLLGGLDSFQVLFVSSLFAALSLLIINALSGRLKLLRDYHPADYLKTVLCCLPGTLLYYIFYYTGTSMMLASQAFIVNYLWPIMSVIFACVILRERLTFVKVVAILLSFAGVIIVIGEDLFTFNPGTLLGALCCILGAVSYGVFTALNQKSSYDKTVSLMIAYFATFIITGVICLFSVGLPVLDFGEVLGLLWNGAFAIGIANMLWMLALGAKDTAKISNLAYLTPFISLIWTSLFLEEEITAGAIIGLGVIMLGILIQVIRRDKEPTAEQLPDSDGNK